MPIATLRFILPEEKDEFDLAQHGGRWHCVVTDLDDWLRELHKHHNKKSVKIEEVRAKILELMSERGLA